MENQKMVDELSIEYAYGSKSNFLNSANQFDCERRIAFSDGFKACEEKMGAEVNRLVYELDKSRDSHQRIIASLAAQVEMMEDALKYYGDERNWCWQDTFCGRISLKENNDDIYLVGFEHDDHEEVGGRRAFEALSKLKTMRGEGKET